jgi:hypothetical protein
LPAGSHYSSFSLYRTGGVRRDCFELDLWTGLRADDHFVHGESNKHKLRVKQHIELGGNGRDKYNRHAGDIHVHSGERLHEHEPDGDDHLQADGNQCRWLGHVHANHYRKRGKQQAND